MTTRPELDDTDPMPFGKHKDLPMHDVPADYLHYLWCNGLREKVRTSNVAHYIARNLDALRMERKDLIWDPPPQDPTDNPPF